MRGVEYHPPTSSLPLRLAFLTSLIPVARHTAPAEVPELVVRHGGAGDADQRDLRGERPVPGELRERGQQLAGGEIS